MQSDDHVTLRLADLAKETDGAACFLTYFRQFG